MTLFGRPGGAYPDEVRAKLFHPGHVEDVEYDSDESMIEMTMVTCTLYTLSMSLRKEKPAACKQFHIIKSGPCRRGY